MRRIFFALAGLLLFASLGCEVADQLEGMRTVQAEYEPKGRKILIIPFAARPDKTRPLEYDYFSSAFPEGSTLSSYATHHIQLRAAPAISADAIPHGEKLKYIQAMEGAEDLNPYELDEHRYQLWKQMAQNLDCEMILVGEIHDLRTSDPKSPTLVRGELVFSARLYDLSNDAVAWQVRDKLVNYPEGQEYDAGVPWRDLPAKQLETRLLERGGEVISQYFHKHRVPR